MLYTTNKKRYFETVVWIYVLLLGAAKLLWQGLTYRNCCLSLGGPLVLVALVDVSCICSLLYITRSVSLVYMHFLRNALQCHCACVWYRWPVIIWQFGTYCVFYNC